MIPEVYDVVHIEERILRRGRAREAEILSHAIQVLQQRGYDAMTIDAVAALACASKATIYKRWRNKAELVAAALDSMDAEHNAAIPDTGDLRSDLVAVMESMREKATAPYVAMISELVAASRRDEVLAALLRKHAESEALSPFQEVLCRAIHRGVLPSDLDTALIHDVAEAMIIRQLQMGLPFDSLFIERVVVRVLLPLLTQG